MPPDHELPLLGDEQTVTDHETMDSYRYGCPFRGFVDPKLRMDVIDPLNEAIPYFSGIRNP